MENKKRDDTASLTAEAHGCTPAYVRLVVNGKRNNEDILSTYNKILSLKKNLVESAESTAKTDK